MKIEDTSTLSLEYLLDMEPGAFKGLILWVLREKHGEEVFEKDKKTDDENEFILEIYRAEKGVWGIKTWELVKCVRWVEPIGKKELESFLNLMTFEGADYGYFITIGTFRKDALGLAEGKPLELIDGGKFLDFLKDAYVSGNFCKNCLAIPTDIRKALENLRGSMEALGRYEREFSGKAVDFLHLDIIFSEILNRVKKEVKSASINTKKEDLLSTLGNLHDALRNIEKHLRLFEKVV